jgi:hypothetical protein
MTAKYDVAFASARSEFQGEDQKRRGIGHLKLLRVLAAGIGYCEGEACSAVIADPNKTRESRHVTRREQKWILTADISPRRKT